MRIVLITLCLFFTGQVAWAATATCSNAVPGQKQLLWGDLHVHTAHSMDAWAFGATATPRDAYAFAKGQPLRLANGELKTIDRPLDFAAVTDHPETWDQMYTCTDPEYADTEHCNKLRDFHRNRQSARIFFDYLIPMVSSQPPSLPEFCDDTGNCEVARYNQWRRAQFAANEADEPCEFSALIGYEWTASPGGRHWHRNVIFRGDAVTPQAYDYVRFPEIHSLWQQLDQNCLEEDGCQVLTIPHNINWADGGPTFAVETETDQQWALRTRYERLAEIFQEKGASECLPERAQDLDEDCDFNLVHENAAKARLSGASSDSPAEVWKQARSSYYRTLLGRGLLAYQSGTKRENPLMLGAIASTDTHFGTPGRVAEGDYSRGISTMFLTDEEQLASVGFNPGGLVAVWAEENTRAGVFDALHRREAYGTSGPRIKLKFGVASKNACSVQDLTLKVPMGGTYETQPGEAPWFAVLAGKDDVPLAKIQIIKGEVKEGQLHEEVITVAAFDSGKSEACVVWQDSNFNGTTPAYWYARVLETETPRWSKRLCERNGLCEKFPEADQMVAERAWSSPVWHLP
jgi:uncharacterized protein DUF3604